MTHSVKHLFHINAKRDEVYKAISSLEGLSNWWTKDVKGDTGLNGVIKFRFAENGGPDMKVKELKTGESVIWECIESPHGWVGNQFSFQLDEHDGKTRVRFTHGGFPAEDDYLGICTFTWGRYMESLRQYCQTGKGEAFGTSGYRL